MNNVLWDVIEHHIWANDTLLAFCERLTDEQLQLTVPGTFGPVLKTLVHVAESEQIYLSRTPGSRVERTMDDEAEQLPTVGKIRAALRETGEGWRSVVRQWPENCQVTYQRKGQQEQRSVSFLVAQALDHGSEHRNHIRTILSTHGITPPEIDGWAWDDQRGTS